MSDHDEGPKAQLLEGGTGWMYDSSNKVDLEAYLLGKRIDDAIDPTKQDVATDWVAGTGGDIQDASDIATRAAIFKTKDAFAKAREDPMFVIEKKKRNAKVDLKNNPLRMQKIRELLASELKKDLKKKKKKHKSKKERSVSLERDIGRTRDEPCSARPDEMRKRDEMCPARPNREDDIMKASKRRKSRSPYKSNERRRQELRRSPKHNEKQRHDSTDEEYRTSLKKCTVKRHASDSEDRRKRHDSPSPDHSKTHKPHGSKDLHRSHKSSESSKINKRYNRSPESTKSKKRYNSPRSDHVKKRHDTASEEDEANVASPEKQPNRRSQHHNKRFKRQSRPKMTAEEMERRRNEMMQDAETRDVERREKFVGLKAREDADTLNNKKDGAEFVQDLKVASYSSKNSTLEGRIKSGIFSKQRTKADLSTFLSR